MRQTTSIADLCQPTFVATTDIPSPYGGMLARTGLCISERAKAVIEHLQPDYATTLRYVGGSQ